MKSPTLNDVARHAGVSYATADRVVNRRGNVAAKSVQKVEQAVASLGYVRNLAAANLARGRMPRLAFLLPSGANDFFAEMRRHIATQARHLAKAKIAIDVHEVDAFAVEALSARLKSLAAEGYDGLAIVGLADPGLAPDLAALRDAGTAVLSLVSDLPQAGRAAYVGIDNRVAGAMAARFIGMAHGGAPGRVQIVAGSLQAADHADRLAGFLGVLRADFPGLTCAPLLEARDDPRLLEQGLLARLAKEGEITAIYSLGAGTEGLLAALAAHPARDRPRPLYCIAHELTPLTRQALQEGRIDLVIDQRPDIEVQRAVTLLRALADGQPLPPFPVHTPTIYLRDNLPPAGAAL